MGSSAIVLSLLCSATLGGSPGAEEPASLDTRHQLFLDDYLIASTTRVRRTVEPAEKFPGNPVLWPTEPWEPSVATLYGSVLRDGGVYRMWYKSGTGVAYAESDDGIVWRKPAVEATRVDGQATNILFRKTSKTASPEGLPHYYELFGVHRGSPAQGAMGGC